MLSTEWFVTDELLKCKSQNTHMVFFCNHYDQNLKPIKSNTWE